MYCDLCEAFGWRLGPGLYEWKVLIVGIRAVAGYSSSRCSVVLGQEAASQ